MIATWQTRRDRNAGFPGILAIVFKPVSVLMRTRRFPHPGTAIHIFQRSNRLITDGFYSICRNPMYFGLALVPFGLAVKVNAPITFALAAASALVSDF
jgi:protein-S-isoprenylcysteine O-methyltransferase Ste14